MKTLKFIAIAASVAILAASCKSNGGVKVEAQLPSQSEIDSVSYLIGINFGYFIKANNFGEDLNYAQIKKGMMDFIKSEGQPGEEGFNDQFKISPDAMNEMFNSYIQKRNAYEAELNQKTGEKFLDANKMKDGVVVTESGLQYKIIEAGNDVKAGPVDTVYVHYTGTLIDGTEFDASDRAGEPVKMFMNRVIKGWTEGLQLVGEGGRIQLFIPADLAYGARKMGKIEANSTLIFDVDVVKVGKVPATEEE
ncbi:MAG: FKBP-type peptidyl-prolyl cis-trans isomerase [Bacteroidales bacterium]|nr:FKBP-type peptidyl-prolyl cis-trans isomerase [Bacteroidales bacterium]MDE7127034.1 FKBP-type peptidyl-prolyl cis-trans isomerase [Bacteroidales bacterium]